MIERTTKLNDLMGRVYQDRKAMPILSALFEGPLEQGRDVIDGGALINSSRRGVIGFADVVDSLSAIQELVYDRQELTLHELRQKLLACDGPKVGRDAPHPFDDWLARLRDPEHLPKYGTPHPIAQANACWVIDLLDRLYREYGPNYRGGEYRVGYWTMTNHAGLGLAMGALPNGRPAGRPFASGITPVSGVMPYLAPVLNSVAALPSDRIANGMALNVRFAPEPTRSG